MKNLKPYKENSFEVHLNAVNKKQKGELKNRLLLLNPYVEVEFFKFSEKFKTNQLSTLIPNSTLFLSKKDLFSLYSSQSSVIISLRENIRNLQIKTIITTCQNCTINSTNTLDHILPKSSYPEFVVNPLNLFPCCSTCNSYKLDAVESSSNQKFLNLYLDSLPNEQYLFVDVNYDINNDIDFKFYLKNIDDKINSTLFSVIESHYKHLHLFERMKLKSIEYVSEFETKIQTFRHGLTFDTIKDLLTKAVEKDKAAYGDNHWKCILEIALLNNSIFSEKYK
jgi:hypothetical protein